MTQTQSLTQRGGRRASPHVVTWARLMGDTSVLSADESGGAGQGEAEGDDGERGQDVEEAVHLDRHDLVPFLVERRCSGRPVRCGRCLDSTYLNGA